MCYDLIELSRKGVIRHLEAELYVLVLNSGLARVLMSFEASNKKFHSWRMSCSGIDLCCVVSVVAGLQRSQQMLERLCRGSMEQIQAH